MWQWLRINLSPDIYLAFRPLASDWTSQGLALHLKMDKNTRTYLTAVKNKQVNAQYCLAHSCLIKVTCSYSYYPFLGGHEYHLWYWFSSMSLFFLVSSFPWSGPLFTSQKSVITMKKITLNVTCWLKNSCLLTHWNWTEWVLGPVCPWGNPGAPSSYSDSHGFNSGCSLGNIHWKMLECKALAQWGGPPAGSPQGTY